MTISVDMVMADAKVQQVRSTVSSINAMVHAETVQLRIKQRGHTGPLQNAPQSIFSGQPIPETHAVRLAR
jgi:hypothetical protein